MGLWSDSHRSEGSRGEAAMGRTRKPAVIDARNRKALTEFFSKGGQALLPLLELVEQTQSAVDEVIDVVGRAAIEAILLLSAEQVAGPKVQGQGYGKVIYINHCPAN